MIIEDTRIHRYCSACGSMREIVTKPQKEMPELGCETCSLPQAGTKPIKTEDTTAPTPEEELLKKIFGD